MTTSEATSGTPGGASAVLQVPPAGPAEATAHFGALLAHETDCADVHQALADGSGDFVLLDVRSPEAYAAGHVPGADNLPHRQLDEATLAPYPTGTAFVVYCAGPHCNGADKAALRLAQLGRPVKKMIGGVTGWLDEGLALTPATTAPATPTPTRAQGAP
jgi:rhodanese-related sulfurtransferase